MLKVFHPRRHTQLTEISAGVLLDKTPHCEEAEGSFHKSSDALHAHSK